MKKQAALIVAVALGPPLLFLLAKLASPVPDAGGPPMAAPPPRAVVARLTPGAPGGGRVATPVAVSRSWYAGAGGYERAVAEQRASGAPMAVYFYVDWCPYCARMGREILPAREVRQFLDGVVKVRVNPESGAAEAALAEEFGVRGFPSFFVVPQVGGVDRAKVHPFKRDGDLTPSEFVEECRRALGQAL
jgi:thiol:disulfide interchange protein